MNPEVKLIMDETGLSYNAAYARYTKDRPARLVCERCGTQLLRASLTGLCGLCELDDAA